MIDELIVEESSGNVFADLGYLNAEDALEKSRLAQRIAEIIEERNLTPIQAAAILSSDRIEIQKLIRGQLREFSIDRLSGFLKMLEKKNKTIIDTRKIRIIN